MMKTDIEIAQECTMEPITEVAERAGIPEEYLEQYGKYKAKIDYNFLKKSDKKDGKLILVTAINPTPAGEGKTTTTVGLADALQRMGKKPVVALREPSLGPVFGMKGGAAGGGYAQVVPMEDINLHFTGDFHAIGAANNLLAAMIDNHIYQGNDLNIDPRKIVWKRCVDMNDRQLRFVTDGLGGRVNGVPREDGYDITVASEIMAIQFCFGICRECIDRNHTWKTVYILNIADMLHQVWNTFFQCFQILFIQIRFCNASIILQCSYRCYNDYCIRFDASHTALDI